MALALHKSIAELEVTLTEEEFLDWRLYDSLHMLPQRRMEYYMAQLTLQVVGAAGNKAKLNDFLFDDILKKVKEDRKPSEAEQSAQVLGAMTGTKKIVYIGKKRRHG